MKAFPADVNVIVEVSESTCNFIAYQMQPHFLKKIGFTFQRRVATIHITEPIVGRNVNDHLNNHRIDTSQTNNSLIFNRICIAFIVLYLLHR